MTTTPPARPGPKPSDVVALARVQRPEVSMRRGWSHAVAGPTPAPVEGPPHQRPAVSELVIEQAGVLASPFVEGSHH